MPEAAVLEDLAGDVALIGFDEGGDLRGAAALGAEQRVGLVDAVYEDGPASAAKRVEADVFRCVAWAVVTVRLCVWLDDGLFGAVAASFCWSNGRSSGRGVGPG